MIEGCSGNLLILELDLRQFLTPMVYTRMKN